MLDGKTYDIMADIEFHGDVIAQTLNQNLEQAFTKILSLDDFRLFANQYADDVITALGDEIDALEADIRKKIPEAKFLDIEAH